MTTVPKSQSSGNNIVTPPISHDTGNIIKSDSNISGLQSSSTEHIAELPAGAIDKTLVGKTYLNTNRSKLGTPDTLQSSSKGTFLEKEISSKQPSTIPPIPSLAPDIYTNPYNIIKATTSISKLLADVIEKTKLYSLINGKKYVRVEGWETLGALLLCSVEIIKVEEYKNGYRAEAIVKNQDGKIISNGIGICLRSEKNWTNRDDYAICSMAQTRAIGKAYRLGFAWIMSLAGYEVCPAEEIES